MFAFLSKIRETGLDILFPPLCLLCRTTLVATQKSAFLCELCIARIPLADTFLCGECHARLPENRITCHADTPYRLFAATRYEVEPVRRLIWYLKYERHPVGAHALGYLLTRSLSALNFDFSGYVIVPVPLHRSRLRTRGFNQAELIARPVALRLGLPFRPQFLERTRATPPQAECRDVRERNTNMMDAFHVPKGIHLKGVSILLVDDVTTSGATLREAAKALRAAGAHSLIAAVAARAS